VVNHKPVEWANHKMFAYIRPQTLFNANNFEGSLSVTAMPLDTLGEQDNIELPSQPQSSRAKNTAAIMDIGDTNW